MEKKNDFYLRKICDHNAFEVWLVDGAMIRRDISEDFVGQGYHTWCHYIPQNEIWIEKDTNEDEWKYFLENIDFEIKGLEEAGGLMGVVIFHAGTKSGARSTDGKNTILTTGGRVLNVTALGSNLKNAIGNCYSAVSKIRFDRMHYRRDIGLRAINR